MHVQSAEMDLQIVEVAGKRLHGRHLRDNK